MAWDDYQYSQEAYERNLRINWKCFSCGDEYEDVPGCNENLPCSCGGTHERAGESYDSN